MVNHADFWPLSKRKNFLPHENQTVIFGKEGRQHGKNWCSKNSQVDLKNFLPHHHCL